MGAKFDSMVKTGANYDATVTVKIKGVRYKTEPDQVFWGHQGEWTTTEQPDLHAVALGKPPRTHLVQTYVYGYINSDFIGFGSKSQQAHWSQYLAVKLFEAWGGPANASIDTNVSDPAKPISGTWVESAPDIFTASAGAWQVLITLDQLHP